jgi:hypothetical protein
MVGILGASAVASALALVLGRALLPVEHPEAAQSADAAECSTEL